MLPVVLMLRRILLTMRVVGSVCCSVKLASGVILLLSNVNNALTHALSVNMDLSYVLNVLLITLNLTPILKHFPATVNALQVPT